MIKLIGLSGYAQSGKDTAANYLKWYGFNRLSFADGIRDSLYALDPIVDVLAGIDIRITDMVDEYGWEKSKESQEVRELLQRFGTEVGRKLYGENFWVDIAFKDLNPNFSYVFSDCRFPNEAQAVVDHGGEVWRIGRPGGGAVNGHASEVSLDDWDFDRFIENDGTLEEFKAKVTEGLS